MLCSGPCVALLQLQLMAVAPTSTIEAAQAQLLQQKLSQLEAAVAQRDAESDRKLKAMRLECEKMRADTAKR